ncbi:hypothetical protein A7975_09230 [Bacillus sp. FJAT-26390]|nr:hypothetical protein A7975_09230 [Bacillus sp. FJAT-26390]
MVEQLVSQGVTRVQLVGWLVVGMVHVLFDKYLVDRVATKRVAERTRKMKKRAPRIAASARFCI